MNTASPVPANIPGVTPELRAWIVSQAEAGEVVPGTPAGAPANPRLGRKMAWATAISAVLWAGCAYLILGGVFTREDIMQLDQLIR